MYTNNRVVIIILNDYSSCHYWLFLTRVHKWRIIVIGLCICEGVTTNLCNGYFSRFLVNLYKSAH